MAGQTTIRNYKPQDTDELFKVFSSVYNPQLAERKKIIWDWKYHKHPFTDNSKEYPSLVAERDGKIIGFIGAIPAKFKIQGRPFVCVWCGDFIIDPNERGMAGVRLAKEAIKSQEVIAGRADSGTEADLIAYKLWGKLSKSDRLEFCTLPNLAKKICIEQVLAKKIKIKSIASMLDNFWWETQNCKTKKLANQFTGDIETRIIDRFTDEHSKLLKQIEDENLSIHSRAIEYMNWRLCDMPDTHYEILGAYKDKKFVGYIAARVLEEHNAGIRGRIVDIGITRGNEKVIYPLLAKIEDFFRKNKAKSALVIGSQNNELQHSLELAGYLQKNAYEEKAIFISPSKHDEFHIEEGWNITLADTDYEMD